MSENLIDMGDRGFYHKKNPLNDLTGKEWIYFTNSMLESDFDNDEDFKDWLNYISDSIIDTRYSTSGDDSFEHKLRKQHPTPKPPQLMRDIISFFTKEEQTVLDPFMGVGGTLIGASLIKRNAIGIDLDKKYIDIYKEVSKKLGYKRGDFPKTESQSKKIITLPIHQDLKRSDIIRICKLVNKFVGN